MKQCPFCAEKIQDEAIKCLHCSTMLEEKEKRSTSGITTKNNNTTAAKSNILIKFTKIILISIVVILGFFVITKPDEEELRKQIYSQILFKTKSINIRNDDDFLDGVAKFGCRIYSDECAKEIYNQTAFVVIDKIIFRVAAIARGNKHLESCIGALNTWKCWKNN